NSKYRVLPCIQKFAICRERKTSSLSLERFLVNSARLILSSIIQADRNQADSEISEMRTGMPHSNKIYCPISGQPAQYFLPRKNSNLSASLMSLLLRQKM